MAFTKYDSNVNQAIAVFNEICKDQRAKLEFIKEIYETDGAANMNYKLDQLEKIMRLVCDSGEPGVPKNYFKNNLNLISKSDSPEDILALFKRTQKVIDEFCISYLTFKQSFDFDDPERTTLIKIQNAIAKQVSEFVFGGA